MKRLKYLDYAKGFAILLMLFAHTMTDSNYLHNWIFSFHMPIFFIIGGIILEKKFRRGTQPCDILVLLKKRAFQLGIPYLFWGILLALFYSALSIVSGNQPKFFEYGLRLICFRGIDSLWFLPAYFFAELLTCLLLLIKGIAGKIIRISFFVCGVACILFSIRFPFSLVLVCFCFTYCGYIIAYFEIIEKINIFIALVMFAAGIPLAIINGSVGLSALTFNNGFLYILNSLITSIAVISILYCFEQKNVHLSFLEFFGRDSIVVLCTNNLLIEAIRVLDSKLTGNILINLGLIGCVVFTVILIALELCIIYFSKKGCLSHLFGKRKTNGKNVNKAYNKTSLSEKD